MSELAERLGYPGDARLLIVNCDDLGFTHAANVGVYEALRDGIATSASIMIPCPWAREAASHYRGEDVGVHLTLTAEYDLYRWGPITHAPSLLDGDGGFPRTNVDAWEHADLDEVRRECRAQVERAILWGFDVSHLDSHMGTMQLRPEFFDIYLDLAVEYRLPIRLSGASTQRAIGFPFRDLAAEEGILFPDRFVYVGGIGSRKVLERTIFDLPTGVTEVYVHPSIDTPEARSIHESWAGRVDDLDLVCSRETRALLERAGVTLIGYRALRDAQRVPDPGSRAGRQHRRRRAILPALCLVTALSLGACDSERRAISRDDLPTVSGTADHVVVLGDSGFDSAPLEVSTSDVVEFRIVDQDRGIRAGDVVNTGLLHVGESVFIVFDEADVYDVTDFDADGGGGRVLVVTAVDPDR